MNIIRFVICQVICCLCFTPVMSQVSDYIVTNSRDTIYGSFDFVKGDPLDASISFRKSGELIFKSYDPDALLGFNSTKYGPYLSSRTEESMDRIFNKQPLFLKRLLSGEVTLYKGYVKSLKGRVIEGERRNGTVYIKIQDSEEPAFLYSNEGLKKLIVETDCELKLKNYRFNDFEIASLYKEIADCKALESALLVKGKSLDRRIRLYVEGGRFLYRWSSPSVLFSKSEKDGGSRNSLAAGVKKELINNLNISLGLFYAEYNSTASIPLEGRKYAVLSRDSFLSTSINENYLGPEIAVDYRFNIGANYGYTSVGFRYGILLSGRAITTTLNDDSFCITDVDGSLIDCRLNTSTFDSDNNQSMRAFFEPTNTIAPFFCLGYQFSGKVKTYVEVRGNFGTFGRFNPSYLYDEIGVNVGVEF